MDIWVSMIGIIIKTVHNFQSTYGFGAGLGLSTRIENVEEQSKNRFVYKSQINSSTYRTNACLLNRITNIGPRRRRSGPRCLAESSGRRMSPAVHLAKSSGELFNVPNVVKQQEFYLAASTTRGASSSSQAARQVILNPSTAAHLPSSLCFTTCG